MDSDARDDSAAGDAADSPREDRRFVIPTARSLPESEEESDGGEEVSPSQYRQSRMREESHISDGSNGGSSDEEVEVPEEYFSPDEVDHEGEVAPRAVMSKKAALKVDCDAMMRNLSEMTQQLQAVMRLQLAHKREKRMRCEDVEDGDPGPATLANRARAAEFTPPRKKQRQLVPPTPRDSDNDDLESLVSHASSTRKKVQPSFRFVDVRSTARHNQSEIRVWLQSYAIEQMSLAGPYIDKRPKETDVGGMKLAHVSLLFPFLCSCSLQELTNFPPAGIHIPKRGRISSRAISLSIPQEMRMPFRDFGQDVPGQGYAFRLGRAQF